MVTNRRLEEVVYINLPVETGGSVKASQKALIRLDTIVASKLYGVNATIITMYLYCIICIYCIR